MSLTNHKNDKIYAISVTAIIRNTEEEIIIKFIPAMTSINDPDERALLLHEDTDSKVQTDPTPIKHQNSEAIEALPQKNTIDILHDTLPMLIGGLCQFGMMTIDITTVSSLGNTTMISALGLGMTWVAFTTKSVITALNIGTLTICSQAYGAQNLKSFQISFQRALNLRFLGLLVSYLLLAATYWVLKAIQVEDTIATQASVFCSYSMIAMVPYLLFSTFNVFLLTHKIFYPQTFFLVIALACHWFICRYFVLDLGLELRGAALASAVSLTVAAALTMLYSFFHSKTKNSLVTPPKESFQKLFEQFKVEAFIGSFIYFETISTEILSLLGSSYSETQINAQVIVVNLINIGSVPAGGLTTVLSAYMATYMGQKDAEAIRKCVKYGIAIALIYGLLEVTCLLIWKEDLLGLYSTDYEVIQAAKEIIFVYFVFIPMDYIRGVLVTTLKSIGRERIGAITFFVSYYIVGLSLEYVLGSVVKLYDRGLWLGMGVGITSMLVNGIILLMRTDFNKQVLQIEQRIIELD